MLSDGRRILCLHKFCHISVQYACNKTFCCLSTCSDNLYSSHRQIANFTTS